MQETGNKTTMQEATVNNSNQRLTIRVSKIALSFSTVDVAGKVSYEPYNVRSGISMAANLREALKSSPLLQQPFRRTQVVIDSPSLLVPTDLFQEQEATTLFTHSYPKRESEMVMYNVLPDLNAVALFCINKDLKLVIDDHFAQVTFVCAMAPVWRYLHQRSFTGARNKLYAYFHDKQLTIFSYTQNRFKFCNSFETTHAHDALYFILYVWKQLMMKAEFDELHLVGEIPEQEWLLEELRRYVLRTYVISPTGDFNRAPVTQIKTMPYDLMTLYVRGR